MPRQIVDGQDVATAIAGGGGGAGSDVDFGDGSLGNVIISSFVDAFGDQNYSGLTVQTGASLAAVAGLPLIVRSQGSIELQGTGAIHADGRGTPGSAGGNGGGLVIAEPGVAGTRATSGSGLICASGGGGGGGGQGAFSTGGGFGGQGGDGAGQSLDRDARPSFDSQDYTPITLVEAGAGTSQTMHSFTLPASTMTKTGDYLDIIGWGNIDTTIAPAFPATAYTIAFNFGSATFTHVFDNLNDYNGLPADTTWIMRVRVYFKSPSTQAIVISLHWHGDAVASSFEMLVRQETIDGTESLTQPVTVDWFGSLANGTNDGNTLTQSGYKARAVLVDNGFSLGGDGGTAGPTAENGTTATPIVPLNASLKSLFLSRRMAYRVNFPLGGGAGGGGGGGGAGGQFVPPAGGVGGAAGSQVGAGLGTGLAGSPGGNGGSSSAGGGGGGGGAGGGYLEVWCAGDLTIGGSSRISANGGNGGAGAAAGTAATWAGGGGGGGAGGAGGSVFVAYSGTPSNVDGAHVTANGGTGGGGASAVSNGGAGAAGLAGETGCSLFVAV